MDFLPLATTSFQHNAIKEGRAFSSVNWISLCLAVWSWGCAKVSDSATASKTDQVAFRPLSSASDEGTLGKGEALPRPSKVEIDASDSNPSASVPPVSVTVLDRYSWTQSVDPDSTIASRVRVPVGFSRIVAPQGSFAAWLRTLPVKPGLPLVRLHDGREKQNQTAHALVIDIDTGRGDLQQCADAVMRLRAEYLYSHERFDEIHFDFTTGDRASYSAWRQGSRPEIFGSRVSWKLKARPDTSYAGFRAYLTSVFIYAGTASLSRELLPQDLSNIEAGNVFIVGGYPGHAVIVVDVARNPETNQTLFLLAQSYMPAQDIHLLNNPRDAELSPWYSSVIIDELVTPEWTFSTDQLKRFAD